MKLEHYGMVISDLREQQYTLSYTLSLRRFHGAAGAPRKLDSLHCGRSVLLVKISKWGYSPRTLVLVSMEPKVLIMDTKRGAAGARARCARQGYFGQRHEPRFSL